MQHQLKHLIIAFGEYRRLQQQTEEAQHALDAALERLPEYKALELARQAEEDLWANIMLMKPVRAVIITSNEHLGRGNWPVGQVRYVTAIWRENGKTQLQLSDKPLGSSLMISEAPFDLSQVQILED